MLLARGCHRRTKVSTGARYCMFLVKVGCIFIFHVKERFRSFARENHAHLLGNKLLRDKLVLQWQLPTHSYQTHCLSNAGIPSALFRVHPRRR